MIRLAKSLAVRWASFMCIMRRNLFDGEMADFKGMEQVFNDFNAPIEAPDQDRRLAD